MVTPRCVTFVHVHRALTYKKSLSPNRKWAIWFCITLVLWICPCLFLSVLLPLFDLTSFFRVSSTLRNKAFSLLHLPACLSVLLPGPFFTKHAVTSHLCCFSIPVVSMSFCVSLNTNKRTPNPSMYGLKPANDATHSDEAQSGNKHGCLHHCLLFLPEVLEDIHQKVCF